MNIKWNGLLVHYLILLSVLGLVSSLQDLTIQCTEGCKVENNVIVAKDGRTIKFIISIGEEEVLALKYDGKTLLTAMPSFNILTLAQGADSRFQHGNYIKKNGTSDIPVTFKNISVEQDNKKAFNYSLKFGNKKIFGKKVLDVLAPPKICGRSQSPNKSYVIEENGSDTINFTLCGNPAPKVVAKVDINAVAVRNIPIKGGYHFKYLTSLEGITRNECGKIMSLAVDDSTISFSTKLWVKFTPINVENITANLDDNDCLTVKWKRNKAGNCKIHYELQYEKNGTLKNVTLTKEMWNVCNSSLNDTINVRAFINEQYGKFYGKFNPKPIYPMPPPPKPVTRQPTTGVSISPSKDPSIKEAESSMHWKYILAIVVGVIALLLIIAVVIIASRRKGKSKGDNNNGQLEILRSQPEEESDYAEVNSLRTPSTKEPPPDENHMVYAELGPGGGRTGPKPVPEESNYAKVKTEGLYYPPLQQSFRGEPKKSFYEPPKYSVASRNKKELRPSLIDDDDDDYVEDILV